jgi:hypothetical protein
LLTAVFALGVVAVLQHAALADSAATSGPSGTEQSPLLTTGQASGKLVAQAPTPPPPSSCATPEDVDKNYACLDAYLGEDFFTRLFDYYKLELGQPGAPDDPNAPPSRIEGWPRPAATTPPMPYTEWPMGAVTPIGVTRPNSVDSPFMAAIANTSVGKWDV